MVEKCGIKDCEWPENRITCGINSWHEVKNAEFKFGN